MARRRTAGTTPRALLAAEGDRAAEQSVDEPLETDGHLVRLRPIPATTRSISDELTRVLPTAAPSLHPSRWVKR